MKTLNPTEAKEPVSLMVTPLCSDPFTSRSLFKKFLFFVDHEMVFKNIREKMDME